MFTTNLFNSFSFFFGLILFIKKNANDLVRYYDLVCVFIWAVCGIVSSFKLMLHQTEERLLILMKLINLKRSKLNEQNAAIKIQNTLWSLWIHLNSYANFLIWILFRFRLIRKFIGQKSFDFCLKKFWIRTLYWITSNWFKWLSWTFWI